LRFHKNLLKFI